MLTFHLDHVAINVRDLAVSATFYEQVFSFERLKRPPFQVEGIWYRCGGHQIHLVRWSGNFRTSSEIDVNDIHFALRTTDFEGAVSHLRSLGLDPDLPSGDRRRIHLNRNSIAGFPQMYFLDPDLNQLEINGAPA